MPITELQRDLRRKHLGASDAAAVLGLSKYRSPADVWTEKVLDVEPLEETPAMEWGNRLEGAVIEATADRLGVRVRRNQRRVARNGIMAANIDAMVEDTGEPLEVKTSSLPAEWGAEAEGVEGVPIQYAVQVAHQCIVADAPRGHLGVFLMGFRPELRVYTIEVDGLAAGVEESLCEWWRKWVIPKVCPPDCAPADLDTLRRVARVPGASVVLPADLVSVWRDAELCAKKARENADEHKARVLQALGDAESGVCPGGEVTYLPQTRKGYTVAETTFRTLRFKAAKAGGAA